MSGIYPHNSDHCHCPDCDKVRGQVRDLARLEVNAAPFDQHRKMQRALEDHHKAQLVGGRLSRDEAARAKGWSSAAEYEEHLLKRQARLRAQQAVHDRIYFSPKHGCHWRWRCLRGGWAKVAVTTGRALEHHRFRKVEHTPGGYKAYHMLRRPWSSTRIESEDRFKYGRSAEEKTVTRRVLPHGDVFGNHHVAVEHSTTKRVGELSQTVTDRVEFEELPAAKEWLRANPGGETFFERHKFYEPNWKDLMSKVPAWADGLPITNYQGAVGGRWTSGAKTGADAENDPINLKQESPVLSPLKLSILLWRAAHPNGHGYPAPPFPSAGALRELERDGLITFGVLDGEYVLTQRAKVLVEAIKALPLPIRPEPTWEMPS